MIIDARAYARAGLLGNPSDGYFGKTISISVRNFGAHILLYESPELHIEPQEQDINRFGNIHEMVEAIGANGYYGGDRLVKATIKRFYDFCRTENVKLHAGNFTIRYSSSIPRQVGLAGSSAIVTAVMRALIKFYGITIPQEILPSLVLSVERDELGINAGLQDRVIQVYEGCVYMDFNEPHLREHGHGIYEPIDPALLPHLYIAYKTELSKVSGAVLNDIKIRFDKGDKEVHTALGRIAALAEEGRSALATGNTGLLNELINENFDQRAKIMNISASNMELVDTARKCGVSAKFSGSGGAIIGVVPDDAALSRLVVAMKKLNARVIRPYMT